MNWLFLVYMKGFILILILGVEFTRTLLGLKSETEQRSVKFLFWIIKCRSIASNI